VESGALEDASDHFEYEPTLLDAKTEVCRFIKTIE
jgi:hypothetical protein